MEKNPKVFISYSHQDYTYENKVLEFANKLRSEGIDANIDQYEECPIEGWPRWMENQIKTADFVIVICSKSYYDKCYSEIEKGKGINWEVNIVYQQLYDNCSHTNKFIPAFFNANEVNYILTPLKSFTYYNISDDNDYSKLYWRLRGVNKTIKPKLGELKPLPVKDKKSMFITSPIDLEKWNKARWSGMLYLFSPDNEPPILGLIFDNYDVAKDIFKEWKLQSQGGKADDFIKIDFIIPPFPEKCWVYYDKDRNYGKGYFVHIAPNIEASRNRALEAGFKMEELLVATICRYQWMDEINGSKNRDTFTNLMKRNIGFYLIPASKRINKNPVTENNIQYDFNSAIYFSKISFIKGTEINDSFVQSSVLRKPK
mgnify:CR=1 FL=1